MAWGFPTGARGRRPGWRGMRAAGAAALIVLGTSARAAQAQIPLDSLTVLAREAYVFGFPALATYRAMVQALRDPRGDRSFNTFAHATRLADPSFRSVVRPNNDTFFSLAWLDLRGEGVVLTVPGAPPERYRSAQVMDQFTHNLAILSQPHREARRYLIVGPRWRGSPPADIAAVLKAETGFVAVLTRTAVDGPADSAAAAALQRAFTLEERSPPGAVADLPEYREEAATSAGFVDYLDFVLAHAAVHASEEALVRAFAHLGLRVPPTSTAVARNPEARAALDRGVAEARQRIRDAPRLAARPPRGSWRFSDVFGNRERMQGRYLARASAAMNGLFGLDREEAAYFSASADEAGGELRGDGGGYTLRFPADSLPPAQAFWSVTVYDADGFLVPNPIGRYSIGDRTAGLRRDADGGLTIHLRADPPAADQRSNWLPVPRDRFELSLRLYRPDPTLIESYAPPPVRALR